MCPKDQRVCSGMDSSFFDQLQPRPVLAQQSDTFCLSDDDTDGELDGVPPACPMGTTAQSDYCFIGSQRKVEATQVLQCPFMNQLSDRILGIDVDPPEADCTKTGRIFSTIFGWALGFISFFLRIIFIKK
jgi:hypothetical protein